jgi:uncharacterized membrane protein
MKRSFVQSESSNFEPAPQIQKGIVYIHPLLFHQTGIYSIILLPIWVISMGSLQMKRSKDVGILFSP